MLHIFQLIFLVVFSFSTFAKNKLYPTCQKTNALINQLYNVAPQQDIASRIVYFGNQFIGKPYELGALGEGSRGYFDQFPLYRTDAFDCETLVDTVLALAFANNLSTFKHCIAKIRYQNGQVSFITRNHFTCLDWNKNNQKQRFLKDITATLLDKNHQSPALIARAYIDKPNWYQHFDLTHIRLLNSNPSEAKRRLELLKQKASELPKNNSEITYIPLSALFNPLGQANKTLFKQIPNAAIIEIIRPNWDLTHEIGTHLNVSHLGFAIWEKGTLYFLQASSKQRAITKTPLSDYLREAMTSPTIKGINIQVAMNREFCSND